MSSEFSTRFKVSGAAITQTPKYHEDSASTDRMARFFMSKEFIAILRVQPHLKSYLGILDKLEKEGFFDFFILNISDSSSDNYQVTQTLGNNFVLNGFGKSPEILSVSGILKNTREDDWRVQFLDFFKNIAGVSSLAKYYDGSAQNFVTFKYDSYYKRGALLNVNHSLSASNEMDISFSFSFIVTKSINFTQSTSRSGFNNDLADAEAFKSTVNPELSRLEQSEILLARATSKTQGNIAISKAAAQAQSIASLRQLNATKNKKLNTDA